MKFTFTHFCIIIILIIVIFGFTIFKIIHINSIPYYQMTYDNLVDTRMGSSLYAIVYSLRQHFSNDSTRIAIIYPFNWIVLNYKYRIYVYAPTTNVVGCNDSNSSKFAKLKSQLSSNIFSNLSIICLPISIDNLLVNFSNKPNERIELNVGKQQNVQTKYTVIDAINELVLKGYFFVTY